MLANWIIKIFGIVAISTMISMMLVLFMVIFSMGCAGFDIITDTEACYELLYES